MAEYKHQNVNEVIDVSDWQVDEFRGANVV